MYIQMNGADVLNYLLCHCEFKNKKKFIDGIIYICNGFKIDFNHLSVV